ncbi:MAG: MFS transporter [Gleimia sp.]|nr:MFS transporter [Acidobacteriota bacterium]
MSNVKRLLSAIVAIVFFTYIGQFLLNAAIAPLARAMGLAEWHMGAALSLAAVMVTLLSQRWGRASLSWGRKPVLVTALVLALIAGLLFAVTTYARTNFWIPAGVAAAGIILARGGFFGAAVAAVPPTGQALIAELTPDEKSRVRGMAAFGSAFNIAAMVGALLSGLLAAWWLMAPVYATPISVGIALIIAIVMIPSTAPSKKIKQPPKLSPRDKRVQPFLFAGFGMFFAAGIIQICIGFIMQDRFGFAPSEAVLPTGIAMLGQAVGALFSQLVLVPRLAWPPRRLLRIGLLVVTLAVTSIAIPSPLWATIAGVVMIGVGMGLANPGYNAGASLKVSPEEQGSVAGLLSATGGLTWVFAPITGTTLYGWNPTAAILLGSFAVTASTLVAWLHPEFRIANRPWRFRLSLDRSRAGKSAKRDTDD